MLELKPHKNAVIGIKKLSAADLGRSDKSNQTHIGLFENTLNCIDNLHLIDFCYLVTEKETKKLLCLLDYIENPNGTYRSPKIRKGSNEELVFKGEELNSVVREIRKIVSETVGNKDWYLLWFATDNEHLVFVLFEFKSELFKLLSVKLGGITQRQRLESDHVAFYNSLRVLRSYIEIDF
jgi:hypothetical protein